MKESHYSNPYSSGYFSYRKWEPLACNILVSTLLSEQTTKEVDKMWMTNYIREVKRQLRDVYGFTPMEGSTDEDPLIDAPDGEYPMTIEGKFDHVRIVDGAINCCNFDEPALAETKGN